MKGEAPVKFDECLKVRPFIVTLLVGRCLDDIKFNERILSKVSYVGKSVLILTKILRNLYIYSLSFTLFLVLLSSFLCTHKHTYVCTVLIKCILDMVKCGGCST